MVELKKEENKSRKKLILYLSVSLLAIFVLVLILLFSLKTLYIKKAASNLGTESKQASEKGELGSINPLGEDSEISQTGSPEAGGATGSEGGSSAGGGGGGGGSEGSISGMSAGSEALKGSLEIDNLIIRNYTSSNLGIAHYPGASEELDNYDSRYYAMFDPSGIASKIISKVGDYELDADIRPAESETEIYIELSLVSQSESNIKINSANELRISMPLEGYTFSSQTLTLQQYNPDNSSESYPAYDLKKLIEEGNGILVIELPSLSGTYVSAKPYAYFKLTFS